jgi:hypothetical protein
MGKIQISYVEQKFNWGEFRDLGRKTQDARQGPLSLKVHI